MANRIFFRVCTSLLALCIIISLSIFHSSSLMNDITSYGSSMIYWGSSNNAIMSETMPDWVNDFIRNLFSYVAIFGCLWLVGDHLAASGYFNEPPESQESGFQRLMRIFFIGYPSPEIIEEDNDSPQSTPTTNTSPQSSRTLSSPDQAKSNVLHLFICISGLLISYIIWGVLQERIITMDYDNERFQDSQFLVFANRAFGCLIAVIIVFLCSFCKSFKQPFHRASLLDYGYSSVSNILSSWCQYEALKFLSFPTQVLGKACKIIPVMLMGRLVTRQTYKPHEYFTATLLSMGVAMFLLFTQVTKSSSDVEPHNWYNTASGVLLLVGYLLFDSFNSNWQDRLFKRSSVSSLQMMAGTNLWSSVLTVATLFEQNNLSNSFQFALRHRQFMWDILLISVCSAMGQLFIFYTIARFGAVTFVIIMTLRQAISILLSCILYNHPLSVWSSSGLAVVFIALFLRIYFSSCGKKLAVSSPQPNATISDATAKLPTGSHLTTNRNSPRHRE